HADHSTHSRHDARLHQELQQNIRLPRTQRLANTDFARPFRHAGKHHVHDHHASDDEEHCGDAYHRTSDGSSQLMEEIEKHSGAEDAKVVLLSGTQVTTRAHEYAGFLLGALHPFGAARLNVDVQAAAIGAVRLQKSLHGNVGVTVLRLSERAPDFSHHANHLVGPAIYLQRLADWVHAVERFEGDFGAEDRNRSAMTFIASRDVAAFGELFDVHVANAGADASQIHVFEHGVAKSDACVGPCVDADVLRQFQVFLQRLVVLPGNQAIAPVELGKIFERGDKWEARDQENVCTEVDHAAGNVLVGASDQRHDHDQRGHGENNA